MNILKNIITSNGPTCVLKLKVFYTGKYIFSSAKRFTVRLKMADSSEFQTTSIVFFSTAFRAQIPEIFNKTCHTENIAKHAI